MADPRVFNDPVAVAQEEALDKVVALLAGVPEAQATFAEKYGNPRLAGSPASLVEAASDDRMVRDAHGLKILTAALTQIVAHQQERIEKLEKAAKGRAGK